MVATHSTCVRTGNMKVSVVGVRRREGAAFCLFLKVMWTRQEQFCPAGLSLVENILVMSRFKCTVEIFSLKLRWCSSPTLRLQQAALWPNTWWRKHGKILRVLLLLRGLAQTLQRHCNSNENNESRRLKLDEPGFPTLVPGTRPLLGLVRDEFLHCGASWLTVPSVTFNRFYKPPQPAMMESDWHDGWVSISVLDTHANK